MKRFVPPPLKISKRRRANVSHSMSIKELMKWAIRKLVKKYTGTSDERRCLKTKDVKNLMKSMEVFMSCGRLVTHN